MQLLDGPIAEPTGREARFFHISNRGGDRDVLIENNLLAGGAVAIYCEQGAKGINYRVINNAFTRRFGPKVGFYGVSTDCSDEEQSGNYYYETGQPVTL
jgi:hypothetical protein